MLRIPKSFIAGTSAALVISVLCLSTSSAVAQSTPSAAPGKTAALPAKKPDGTWESLKPAQQQILAPLESDWDYMLPDSRKKWIQVANIYPRMSGQDQQRLQSRMASWSKLSQKERRLARENYLSSLKFPAEKKAEAWTAYQKLSDEQKKKLADTQTKKKPSAINAPTLQQHSVNQTGTPPPPTPNPRSMPTAEAPPAPESSSSNN
jgi:hypothetical protein